jgi:TPR repeat protein
MGTPQDDAKAMAFLRESAALGHAGSHNELGVCYSLGNSAVRKDSAEAARFFFLAAEKGHIEGMKNAGTCLLRGEGAAQDTAAAKAWHGKAAAAGCAEAMYYMGCMYGDGGGAREYMRKAAAGGFASAQYNMGQELNDRGKLEEAASWWRKAAEQGVPEACHNLSSHLLKLNDPECVIWLRRLVKQGNATAMVRLGVLLLQGTLAPQDVEGAMTLIKKAAALGCAEAILVMGKFASVFPQHASPGEA